MTLNGLLIEPRLLLASKSPRRRRMLREAGVRFEVLDAGVDDGRLDARGKSAAAWVVALAYLKARAGLEAWRANGVADPAVILGADTVVALEDELIGQPRDAGHARTIIERLEDRRHEVLTGVALLDSGAGKRRLMVDRAAVDVGVIGPERIEAYVASGRWAGKAGAYNLCEQVEAGWPISWQGDPGTVMGLPMRRLAPWLAEFVAAGAAEAPA